MAEAGQGPVDVPPPPPEAPPLAAQAPPADRAPPPPVETAPAAAAQPGEAAASAGAEGNVAAAVADAGKPAALAGVLGGQAAAAEPAASIKLEEGSVKAEPTDIAVAATGASGKRATGLAVEPAAAIKAEESVKQEAAAATVTVEPPSDEALLARLRQLLTEVDLATTTEKQLRRRLEGEYGVDLAGRKALLRDEINAYLEEAEGEQEGDGEGEEEEEEEMDGAAPSGRKRKASSGSSLGSFLSPEMQDFLGVQRLPRTQVVKKLWEYIKAHNLQDPRDKRNIIFDDKLKVLFTGTKCNMFKLQKQLSKHCKTSDVVGGSDSEEAEEEEDEEDEDEEAKPAAKKPRSAPARRRGGSTSSVGGEGKQRKPGGFTKECNLSPEMAAWVGRPTASRPEITKFFWTYCKERDLQDPTDRSFILADEALRALTGEARFKGFVFSKLIKEHVTGYA